MLYVSSFKISVVKVVRVAAIGSNVKIEESIAAPSYMTTSNS